MTLCLKIFNFTAKQLQYFPQRSRLNLSSASKLFAVHAFVKRNDEMIQLLLAFWFITRRQKLNYKFVFEALNTNFDEHVKSKKL